MFPCIHHPSKSFSNTSMWSQQKLNICSNTTCVRVRACMFARIVFTLGWVCRYTHICDLFHLLNSLDDTLIEGNESSRDGAKKMNFPSFSVQLTSNVTFMLLSTRHLHITSSSSPHGWFCSFYSNWNPLFAVYKTNSRIC